MFCSVFSHVQNRIVSSENQDVAIVACFWIQSLYLSLFAMQILCLYMLCMHLCYFITFSCQTTNSQFWRWLTSFLQMAVNATDGVSKKDAATMSKAEEETWTKLLWVSCRRFWFSANPLYQTLTLGLALFVYMAVGAAVFVWLEGAAEENRLADISRAAEELKQILSVELPNATSERIDNLVDSFFVACDAGLLANETAPLWDLGRAVMAAGSIVTTIGRHACAVS